MLCQGHINARMKKSALFKGNKDTKVIKNFILYFIPFKRIQKTLYPCVPKAKLIKVP